VIVVSPSDGGTGALVTVIVFGLPSTPVTVLPSTSVSTTGGNVTGTPFESVGAFVPIVLRFVIEIVGPKVSPDCCGSVI
jgi:hypothetical protein